MHIYTALSTTTAPPPPPHAPHNMCTYTQTHTLVRIYTHCTRHYIESLPPLTTTTTHAQYL